KLQPPPPEPAQKIEVPLALHKSSAPVPVTQEVIAVVPVEPTGQVQSFTSPAVLTSSEGVSSPAPVAEVPAFIQAEWTRFPDSRALARYYPARALENEREGMARVECTIVDVSGRVTCVVLSESPANQGFGPATVKMVQAEGRVDTSEGAIKPGSRLITT